MNIFLTKSISCVVTQTLKKIKAEFSRKTRHKITRTQHAAVKKSTFEETHTIKLLLGQAQPLGKHLVLEEQHGLGLHEGEHIAETRLDTGAAEAHWCLICFNH